ncbi:MAG: Multidrug resistance protein MdtB [Chlamydiales bacterium]|nr:Multidrug resistance protein MdtB [Chlamydiales bacterium]
MRALIQYAIAHRTVMYFITLLLFVGGLISFFSLAQLEDPVFTVKTATIITRYPGASPEEVELEVTDRLEQAIQEMTQIKNIYSVSRAGESYIKVNIKQEYWANRLPQVWDELRKKINDAVPQLPPGVENPAIHDDFGFVYGFLLSITGDGFSYRELEDYSKIIRKELGLISGVSRVELWGVQQKVIYLDISEKQLTELSLTPETIHQTLEKQNMVVNAGSAEEGGTRFRIAPTGEFANPEEIGELILRPGSDDVVSNMLIASKAGFDLKDFSAELEKESTNVIRLKDVAQIRTGYLDPPLTMLHFDGEQAIGIQIAGMDDANIVDVGERLSEAVEKITDHLPIGIELHKIAWQSDLVDEAVNGFFINLIEAIIIVLIVLIIPSGLRMGLIIGSNLVLTILGTFIVMSLLDIPLQRMSLGALIIALGMMVDNAIVVTDGIAVRLRQGMERVQAAVEAAAQNAFPLFAATLIAVLTFYPIYASREDAGEYCRTLFIVVATSLLLSWIIALVIAPLQCINFLPAPKQEEESKEFERPLFVLFRKVITRLIKFRILTLICLGVLLVASIFGFGFVKQMFFPDSSRPQLMIDYWSSAGTRIQEVAKDVQKLEEKIIKNPLALDVSTFIGAGPPRFYLPVEPEKNYSNYAQLIINFDSYKDIAPFIAQMEPWALENLAGAMLRFRKYSVGPSNTWKFEARISGPGEANLAELRSLGTEIRNIARSSPYGEDWRTDMMNPVLKIVPEYDQKKGRWSGVNRFDLASATKRGFDGLKVGLYREGDDLYPIVLRNDLRERKYFISNLETLQIRPSFSTKTVPLSQVVMGIENEWEDPYVIRWNRRRAVTVQGAPKKGVTYPQLKGSVTKQIEDVRLPPGYEIYWDGEDASSRNAKKSLVPGMIPAVVLILFLLVFVFNSVRPVLIILLTIPFAMIGITAGLLIFNMPFGFMALLGGMSLVGMMNKNIVVLLDACALNRQAGQDPFQAIVNASISRARPVLLAAGTTILGVIPLLQDIFWESMAVTIMAGLAFGSLLTLIAVPVFYAVLYRVKVEKT